VIHALCTSANRRYTYLPSLVWKILHERVRYVEQSIESEPKLLMYRAQYLAKQLRKFGYNVQITPANNAPA
jgi:hypothetical protein